MRITRIFTFFAVLLFAFAAKAGDTVTTPHVTAKLVSEFSTVSPGETMGVGLHFEIKKGWHTYWKNPGDSGEPIKVRWAISPGLTPSALIYPAPHRIELPPLANFGLENEVLVFSEMTASNLLKAGQDVTIRAEATWLVCEETCIPEKGSFEIKIPVAAAVTHSQNYGLFEKARLQSPKKLPEIAFHLSERGVDFKIPEEVVIPEGTAPFFFPEAQGLIENAAPQTLLKNKVLLLTSASTLTELPKKISGLLVVGDKSYAIGESESQASFTYLTQAATAPSLNVLLLAFLGGLLLNLMPCVFPVLSVKILSFVKKSGEHPKKIRMHGWAYASGVLVSFTALAALLIFLRWSGEGLGWGFQLQSPIFVLLIIFLLFLLALSLLGVFEIGGSWMGLGSRLAARGGLSGSFFTGVLATIVATPCTAPFMGPAIGFALGQPAIIAMTVFLALGLGMAAPYLLLSYAPFLLKRLPKPGAWMETFQQAMAFPLFSTVLWLVWVLNQQAPQAIVTSLLGLLGIGFGAWLGHRVKRARPLALLIGVAAMAWAIHDIREGHRVSKSEGVALVQTQEDGEWAVFSEQKLAALRAEGRPVFVDFTAAWCITCQINKKRVLERDGIRQVFAAKNVALLKADWTNRDPQISKALESFGRQGVPLYVYYPPHGEPKILPALLTKAIVLEALSGP